MWILDRHRVCPRAETTGAGDAGAFLCDRGTNSGIRCGGLGMPAEGDDGRSRGSYQTMAALDALADDDPDELERRIDSSSSSSSSSSLKFHHLFFVYRSCASLVLLMQAI